MRKLWNTGNVRIIGVMTNGSRDNRVVPHTSIALILDFDKLNPERNMKTAMKNQFDRLSVKKNQYSESLAKAI